VLLQVRWWEEVRLQLEPEERTTYFCLVCRVTKLVNQQDLIIKQNKAIIAILNEARDLLAELRDLYTGLTETRED